MDDLYNRICSKCAARWSEGNIMEKQLEIEIYIKMCPKCNAKRRLRMNGSKSYDIGDDIND